MKIKERKHRLPREAYIGRVRCVFTICVLGKKKLFTSKDIFLTMVDMLLDALNKSN